MFNNDLYEHSESSLTYIIENELQSDDKSEDYNLLKQDFDSQIIQSCRCTEDDCSTNCRHGSNYQWNSEFKELVLNEERKSKDVLYECNTLCECSFDCKNRLVVFGPRKDLEIINFISESKGMGLKTKNRISKGAFVCEYAGELLTKAEALKRNRYNDENDLMNYIVCLNESSSHPKQGQSLQTFIDPSKKGNIGRYLNHSCDPNCMVVSVRIDSPVPKLAIFATRDIEAGEELCFHYGGGKVDTRLSENSKTCKCNSKNCMEVLPSWNYEVNG